MRVVTIKKLPNKIPMEFKLGGEPPIVPNNQLAPLQTEKGEYVIHPNYTVTQAAARLPHSAMTNQITDTLNTAQVDQEGQVLSPAAYVVSKNKNMAVSRDMAKDVDLGIAPAYYSEDMHLPEAKQLNFADKYFGNKSKMTPAEMVKSVMKAHPKAVRNEEEDIFAKEANKLNNEARIKPLEIIKGMNEYMKGDIPDTVQHKYGGYAKPLMKADKGIDMSQYDDYIKRELDRLNSTLDAPLPAGVSSVPQSYNAIAGLTGAAFTAAQNPTSQIYQPDAAILRETAKPLSNSVIDSTFANAQATQNQAIQNASETGQISQRDVPNLFSENNLINSRNSAILANADKNLALRRKYAGDVIGWQAKGVEGENRNIEDQNRYLANVGRSLTNPITNAGNIASAGETFKQARNANAHESIATLMQSKAGLDIFNKMYGDKFGNKDNGMSSDQNNSNVGLVSNPKTLSEFLKTQLGPNYSLPLDKAPASMIPSVDEGNSGYSNAANIFSGKKLTVPGDYAQNLNIPIPHNAQVQSPQDSNIPSQSIRDPREIFGYKIGVPGDNSQAPTPNNSFSEPVSNDQVNFNTSAVQYPYNHTDGYTYDIDPTTKKLTRFKTSLTPAR